MKYIFLLVAGMPLLTLPTNSYAEAYLYKAMCTESYSKQGEQEDDLTKAKGKPYNCDSALLSFHKNGNIFFQILDKKSKLTPLGFAGSGFDYDMNDNFATLPVERIYLPHQSSPEQPVTLSGVEGFCFLGGSLNIKALREISCVTKAEIGTQKLVYHINVKIKGIGERAPLPE